MFTNYCKIISNIYVVRFESRLLGIMKYLKITLDNLEGRLKAEGFKTRVLRTLKAWEDSIYPKIFMDQLHSIFLGIEVEVIIMVTLLLCIYYI